VINGFKQEARSAAASRRWRVAGLWFGVCSGMLLFNSVGGAASITGFVWDATIVITSIPAGSGCGLWHTPEPIATLHEQYCLTTILHSPASLLPPFFGAWDDGVRTGVVTTGQLATLPFTLYDQVTVQTNLRTFFTLVITSIASSRGRVYVGTNALLNYELSELMVTNTTLGGYTDIAVTVTAHTNKGHGIFLQIVPEPVPAAALVLLAVRARRRLCARRRPARSTAPLS